MLILLELLLPFLAYSFGFNDQIAAKTEYVEYIPGNINLLISVPHDGEIKLNSIPDRRLGLKYNGSCFYNTQGIDFRTVQSQDICKIVIGRDLYAADIARVVVNEYQTLSGSTKKPHLIIGNLHRTKVDFNRDIHQGAQGDQQGETIYNDYHDMIKQVRATFGGQGLVIDMHGQNHKQNSTEIGYVWSKTELNDMNYSSPASVRGLLERRGLSPVQFLTDAISLGSMLESAGYKAVPSNRQPLPGADKYYRGGFITQEYGSRDGGFIDAIQLEVPSEIRYEGGPELNSKFARKLAQILKTFFEYYY